MLHFTYTRIPSLSPCLVPVIHSIDYVALPASLLTGQDQLPWFEKLPRASAGSLLNMFWIGTCLVLTLAYLSNLRFIAKQYKVLIYSRSIKKCQTGLLQQVALMKYFLCRLKFALSTVSSNNISKSVYATCNV